MSACDSDGRFVKQEPSGTTGQKWGLCSACGRFLPVRSGGGKMSGVLRHDAPDKSARTKPMSANAGQKISGAR